jgi:HK97 family phage prohead protease
MHLTLGDYPGAPRPLDATPRVIAALERESRARASARVSIPREGVDLVRSIADVRATAGADRRVRFIATTRDLDRHGTRIEPDGIDLDRYRRNPIVLWAHDGYSGPFGGPDPANVIGRAVEIERTRGALLVTVEFARHERAALVLELVRQKALGAMSVGFIPRKTHEEREGARTVTVFDEVELVELSIVPIPSNPEALVEGRSLDRLEAAAREVVRGGVAPGHDLARSFERVERRREAWRAADAEAERAATLHLLGYRRRRRG